MLDKYSRDLNKAAKAYSGKKAFHGYIREVSFREGAKWREEYDASNSYITENKKTISDIPEIMPVDFKPSFKGVF